MRLIADCRELVRMGFWARLSRGIIIISVSGLLTSAARYLQPHRSCHGVRALAPAARRNGLRTERSSQQSGVEGNL